MSFLFELQAENWRDEEKELPFKHFVQIFHKFEVQTTEAYSENSQMSNMKFFTKIVNGF